MSDLGPIKSDQILTGFFTADHNPDFNLVEFNFFDEAAVNALNWEGLDREEICDRLKAYQRLLNLGLDAEEAMLQLGAEPVAEGDIKSRVTYSLTTPAPEEGQPQETPKLDSAWAIACLSEEDYVQVCPTKNPEKAREIYRKATETIAGTITLAANVMEVSSPRHKTLLADNYAAIRQKMQSLPSYQKLFGSLDFIQCDPCQSIFSPAAYFVDLMRICDRYLTKPDKENNGFESLSDRRPDLEKIELTCDNTKNTFPYTQIVNEVLREKLQQVLCKEENSNEGEKEKLKGYIKTKDVFQHLATAKYPHNLPFNLHLEQIRTYLGHLNTSLDDIYQVVHPEKGKDKIWAQAYLKLSPEEYEIITTASSETDSLTERYGVNVSEDFAGLTKRETFLKQTGLAWQQLNELLYQNLSQDEMKAGDAHQFFINKKLSEKKYLHLNDKGEIKVKKPDSEEEPNLETLDRIDRFVRLAHKLNWSFTDLDWVLTSIQADDINEAAIISIAKIKQLQAQTKLPLDVLCSFWHEMKAIGKGNNPQRPQDLFNRIFNNPFELQESDRWQPSTDVDNKKSDATEDNENDEDKKGEETQDSRLIRKRLQGSLRLSDHQLTEIVGEICKELPKIPLNLSNLSKLFRIAQIIKLLGFKVNEYKLLLKLLNESRESSKEIKFDLLEIDQLIEIIEFAQWLKTARFSVYELDYILNGREHPSVEVFIPEERMAVLMESLWETEWQPSPEGYKLITTKNDEESLSDHYQVDSSQSNSDKTIEKREFLAQTKISEQEWEALLEFEYLHILDHKPEEDSEKKYIKYPDFETLVRVDRFLGLARKTSWSFDIAHKAFSSLDKINSEFNGKIAHHFDIAPGLFSILAQLAIQAKEEKDYILFLLTQFKTEGSDWGVFQFCTLAILKGIESLAISVFLVMTLRNWDALSDWQEFVDCLKSISRWHLLVRKLALSETELSNIRTYPEIYNIESLGNLTFQNIQNLYNFKNQLVRFFNGSEEYLIDLPESSALIGHWPLDKGQGKVISDKAGDNDGALKGNANWQTATDFPGIVSRKVLQFDGSSNYVELTEASELGLTDSDFTVEAWVKADDLSWSNYHHDQPVLGMDNFDKEGLTGLNKTLHLVIRNKKAYMGFAHADLHGTIPLESGKWYQIVYLYDKKYRLQAIFINGKLDKPDAQMGPLIGNDVVNIGRWYNSIYFKGQIANVRIWKQRLSDDQIFALYNSATIESLLQIKQRVDLSRKLGCSIDFLEELCNLLENSSATDSWEKYQQFAQTVISLTKAKYDDEEWTKVFGKLNGTIEERKTKILTDFALRKLGKENPRQLSEYLLLDVEMTSCAFNSPIQLGILSLQTYLQRCRMGIELGVTTVNIPELWWEWIPNYRKWEANRKVFLYPENYIDPGLRKDASPLFKELQDELLQLEITADTVETAYRHYFDKLSELANLKMVDACRSLVQKPNSKEQIDTLFLIGKTVSQPYSFYYRRCEHPNTAAKQPSWGYWEKIDLQIESDYISSVYAFNRLFVFWVEMEDYQKVTKTPKGNSYQSRNQNNSYQQGPRNLSIKYSFPNVSQKWVSPKTLVEGIPSRDFKLEINKKEIVLDKNFFLKINPVALRNQDKSEVIALVFGDLKSLPQPDEDGSYFTKAMINLLGKNVALYKQLTKQELDKNLYFTVINNHLKPDTVSLESAVDYREAVNISSSQHLVTNTVANYLQAMEPVFKEIKKKYIDTYTHINSKALGLIINNSKQDFYFLKDESTTAITRLTTSVIQKFSQTLLVEGIDGLLSPKSQLIREPHFEFVPNIEHLDFNGAYGAYFWEIFFHIPFLIASTLNAHQRYNEARQWYQHIFNPTISGQEGDKSCFWRFLPFRNQTPDKLEDILKNEANIRAYKENLFDPHAIARLRIGAYQKAVVMKYIDNLLDWGDALFTKDTWEDITQATTLYLLAYELLGEKPKKLGKPPAQETKTFAQLKDKLKTPLYEFLINLENDRQAYKHFLKQFDGIPFNALDAYFCISENQEFARYWDRVEDRLFKIRHCQNIKGIERQLALFAPPTDPKQLVRQAAAGDGNLSLFATDSVPHYRFSYLLERAKGMASTVIQLGSTLLSTLEKKDAEELALLRATQEPVLLQLITKTKEKQIEEAKANLKSLKKSLASAGDRQVHYQKLLDGGWNAGEITSVALMSAALPYQIIANVLRSSAVPAYGTPVIFGTSNGGMQPGSMISTTAAVADGNATILNQSASIASTIAQYQRRQEDWELQEKMADWDVQQIEEQIKAAQVRIELAKAELDVHNKSLEHSREVEQFLKDKFTNKELYQWMVGQLSGIYFQTYKIALDMANSAQKAYQYELTKDDTYIQPTHWDSQKKGLLAGESLMLGLNQLEKAYLDGNDRRLEIEKIISLRQLDPLNFCKLIKYGKCTFNFEEKLFALDFSSHYCRQIKTISVSIPAVVGPYQNINATLTQTGNKVLIKPDPNAIQWLLTTEGREPETGTLHQNWRQHQQIAISKGVNDSGLFVLNFQDERYLPFEGTGAISSWQLDLPKASNPIDLASITDVIITLNYTALEGGSTVAKAVRNYFTTFTGYAFLNLKPELLQSSNSKKLSFTLSPNLFRPNLTKYSIPASTKKQPSIYLQLSLSDSIELNLPSIKIVKEKDGGPDEELASLELAEQGNGIVYTKSCSNEKIENFLGKPWSLSVQEESDSFDQNKITDIVLIINYEAKFSEQH